MVAYSSPVKFVMPLSGASSRVKLNILALVIVVSPPDLPKLSKITVRKLSSGIVTDCMAVKISVSPRTPSRNAFTVSMPTVAPNVNRVRAKPL